MQTPSLSRFPSFELSYETVHHKKVSSSPSVAVVIPMGKKHFLWVFERSVYRIDVNKEKKPVAIQKLTGITVPHDYLLETVIYGTYPASRQTDEQSSSTPPFIVEDMYVWKGMSLAHLCYGDKLGFIRDFMSKFPSSQFVLPCMWHLPENQPLDNAIQVTPGYLPHHIQYREIGRHAPYINIPLPKKGMVHEPRTTTKLEVPKHQIPRFDYRKPHFHQSAVFQVVADVQFDIYHAYAYSDQGLPIYCGPLGIPTYKTSVFMNGIFRNIRENRNLDYIEESDDEDDFENTSETKYVDLEKVANMECTFSHRHKKWVPMKIAPSGSKIVHIRKLVLEPTTESERRQPPNNRSANPRRLYANR